MILMRRLVWSMIVATVIASGAARADTVTAELPYLAPGVGGMADFMNDLATCSTVMKLPLGPGNASILGVPIYQLNRNHPQAPNINAQAGAVFPSGGGAAVSYIALDPSTMEAGDPVSCLVSWMTIHHELHHARWQLWIEATCAAASDPQKCKTCMGLADACMKENDPTGNGDNGFEESRADFATALCLCKKSCDLPEGHPEKENLQALAGIKFEAAQDHWDNGVQAWSNCPNQAMQDAECSFPNGEYPMPPLNPGSVPEVPYGGPYELPLSDPPQPAGTKPDGSCDCEYRPPDWPPEEEWDPCDQGSLDSD